MLEILNVVLPVFVLIGVGYAARWVNLITDALVDALMRFAITFAVPALLFQGISKLDLSRNFDPALLSSFYIAAAASFCIGILGARFLFKRDIEDSIVIGFACLFSNSLMLGLPIAERAYGPEGLSGNFAIISIHSLFAYGVGITTMEIVKARGKSVLQILQTVLKGMLSNALVVAIACAFAANLSGLTIPAAVDDSLDLLARSALPIALFAIGGILRRYRPEGDLRTIFFICLVSLVFHPSLTYLLAHSMDLSKDGLRSAVTTASMAPGVNSYLFANIYGRAKRVAASAVLVGTTISIFSVSIWLIILP
ncbi:AEC family transporter [Cognatishimia activa]|uniref:AEC family transporter n=1 Tax=Cognatishimia activa TaxID=1715691 RepID=UPI0022321475|nr:AEC family transporter [Cognatishimia activa]UZD89575.1 AEC family transporter [Cognatishimia activa]